NEVDGTKKSLELIKAQTLNAISNKFDECNEKFKREMRIETYQIIDSNISNEEFKWKFNTIILANKAKLEKDLHLDEEFKKLEQDIEEAVENLKRYISYVIQDFSHNIQTDFNYYTSMDMDNGIDTMGISASLLGGVMLGVTFFWNPIGWGAIATSAITTIVSFIKGVWNFFDSDYQKSEQRRVADENLQRISGAIEENTEKALEDIRKNIDENIQNIQQNCDLIVENVQIPYDLICQTREEIKQLYHQIQGEKI
ncbi:MAG: hypothetical protein K2I71_05740, partial [Helicobacter sp.]|nr:hypothetical protein [Helicobacter sp.]